MKKITALLFSLLIILVTFTGCNEKKDEVFIKPEISKYSVLMSSVRGIPLNAEFKTEKKNRKIKFHWITEQGVLQNWQQDSGKVSTLGKDIINNGQKIYWTADIKDKIKAESFNIYLKVEDSDSSEVLAETSIEIEQNMDGFFTVKNK